MPTKLQILKKEQILSGLREVRQNILQAASVISAADRKRTFLGVWSIMDLLAHLAGWDNTNLAAVKTILEGKLPSFYAHHDRDWRAYNAILVTNYKKNSYREMIRLLNASHRQLINFLETVPAELYNKDFGVRFRGYKVTIRRLLEAETQDEQIHYKQIQNFFKEPT